jgi:hypothetical protein
MTFERGQMRSQVPSYRRFLPTLPPDPAEDGDVDEVAGLDMG